LVRLFCYGNTMVTTLTSKGQVTVPKAIRERLELTAGDRLEFVLHDDGTVQMIPITSSVKKLKDIVPKGCMVATLQEMEEAIAKGASGDIDWD